MRALTYRDLVPGTIYTVGTRRGWIELVLSSETTCSDYTGRWIMIRVLETNSDTGLVSEFQVSAREDWPCHWTRVL